MPREKRDRRLEPELQLQEVELTETAPPTLLRSDTGLPIGFLIEQVLMELDALPTAAQLSVLRLALPELLSGLDPEAREALVDELGLLRESLH